MRRLHAVVVLGEAATKASMSWAFMAACRRATTRSPIVPASESALGEPTLGVCLARPARATATAPVGPPRRRSPLHCTDRCTIFHTRRDLLRSLGPDQARDPRAPRRRPRHDQRAREALRPDDQRDPQARRHPRARRPRRHREGRARAPLPARVGEPRRGDRVDRRLPAHLGGAARSLRAVRRARGRGRRVSLDLRFERLIAASPERVFDAFTDPEGQREFYGKDAPGGLSIRAATCASAACGRSRSARRPMGSITTITSSRRSSGRAGS